MLSPPAFRVGGIPWIAYPCRTMLRLLISLLFLCCIQRTPAAETPAVLIFDQARTSLDRSLTPPEHFSAATTTLPHDWADAVPGFNGQRWYRIVFDDPGVELPAVYIERVCSNAEVWINGSLIGRGGRMTEPITHNCYYPQLFNIPHSVLKPQGNRLDIRVVGYPLAQVSARQRAGGLSPLQIGPEAELRPLHDTRYFWNITVIQIIGASMVLFGGLMLALGWGRRQEPHFLYFAALQLGFSLIGLRVYLQHLPLPGLSIEVLYGAIFPPVVLAAIQFLLHYARRPLRWVTVLLCAQCVVIPLALVWAAPDHLLLLASVAYTLFAAEFVAALLYFAWHTWREMRPDFWLIGGAELLAVALAMTEIAIQNNWLLLPKTPLILFAVPVVFPAIAIRLVQRFSATLRRAEQINLELERRVAEKSVEIERNYAQLSALRANQAALEERQRIASDLHDDLGAKLVTMTQASLYANDIERIATLARQALDDMRLSVRGLTGAPTPASEVLADWRAETLERLTLAGVTADWLVNDPPSELLLPARTYVQLTRVLRETISNVIRHSGASDCRVEIQVSRSELQLCIQDNGCGLDLKKKTHGHGLPGIERRARVLDGTLNIDTPEQGGTRVKLRVPLTPAASENLSPPEST